MDFLKFFIRPENQFLVAPFQKVPWLSEAPKQEFTPEKAPEAGTSLDEHHFRFLIPETSLRFGENQVSG